MIVACSNCTARLQLDDAKIPTRPFTLRCPKCQSIINVQPQAQAEKNEPSAVNAGESPATEHPRFEQPKPAPAFKLDAGGSETVAQQSPASAPQNEASELVRLLSELLQRGAGGVSPAEKRSTGGRLSWDQRKVLVCVTDVHRELIARVLVTNNYQVYVAADTTQAIERMREERMDIVILEGEFDPVEQGAAFVTREVNALRPAERRRLFFVHLSPNVRTLDSHAAFIQNVNLVVNPLDLENLPHALERGIRDYNELYREFNNALKVASL